MEFIKITDEHGILTVSSKESNISVKIDTRKCDGIEEVEEAIKCAEFHIRNEIASCRMRERLKDIHDIPESKKWLIRCEEDIEKVRALLAVEESEDAG